MASLVSTAIGAAPVARLGVLRQRNVAQAVAAAPIQFEGRVQLAMTVDNRRQLSRPAFAARAAELRSSSGRAGRRSRLAVSASSAAAPAEESKEGAAGKQLVLVGLFVIWYASNIAFNIWNKQLLKLYPFPMTGTYIQLGIGSVLAILMWTFRLKAPPKARRNMKSCQPA